MNDHNPEPDPANGPAPVRPAPTDPALVERVRRSPAGHAPAPWKRSTQHWTRWLHVYASMISFVLLVFFGVTGITLNHPSWTFGDALDTRDTSGTFPFPATFPDGSPDYLTVSEYLRSEEGVSGHVDSFETVAGQSRIIYKNAGYSAEATFDDATGAYHLHVEQAGWVAVLNDLHKGRDTPPGWNWVIDLSAGFLVLVGLTGLTIQLFMRKRRRPALALAVAGGVLAIVIAWLSLR